MVKDKSPFDALPQEVREGVINNFAAGLHAAAAIAHVRGDREQHDRLRAIAGDEAAVLRLIAQMSTPWSYLDVYEAAEPAIKAHEQRQAEKDAALDSFIEGLG